MRIHNRGIHVLALAVVLGGVAACGTQPASPTETASSPSATLPDDAQFSQLSLDKIVDPDESSQLGALSPDDVTILSDVRVTDCQELASWLGAPIPALPNLSATCGIITPTDGLPDRHGKIIPGSSDSLEYTVQVEYAPVGVDLQKVSASDAFDAGLIDVSLRYSANSWNGAGFPTTSTKSNPTDRIDGGYVYGKIAGRDAIVQSGGNGDMRLQTTASIGGDVFALVLNGQVEPETAIQLASQLDFGA